MFWVLLISRCTACFYELLVMQIDLSTLILAWNWLHIKRNVRKRVWRIVLIPFMPPTLKILVKTRLLESQTEVGEPTNYNTSSQALPVFSLGLQQPSSHWIISNRVVSSINIFLSILSVWFSLDHIALCSWLQLWLCLGPHHEWNPTLRQESRVGRLINSHPIYLSFQQIICHCVFTCTHVDDSLKEKNLQQTFISINILHLSYNGDLKNLSSFDFKIIHYIHFESTRDP